MPKHTSGPWLVDDAGSYDIVLVSVAIHGDTGLKKKAIAKVLSPARCFVEPTDDDRAVMLANARLIAAAPTLLEACLAALDRHNYQGTGEPWPNLLHKIQAAVEEAKDA